MKEKNNYGNKILKIAIIICVLLIIILILLLASLKNKTSKEENIINVITEEEKEEKVTDYVRATSERERMQVYIAEFLKHIEVGEYDKAYQKLYPDFKKNFFATETMFKNYVKQHYSSLMSIEYEDIQRQGNYYILSAKIINLTNSQTTVEQKFILQENGLNDYYISFQVQF